MSRNFEEEMKEKEEYEEIRVDQLPTREKWKLTALYRVNAVGNMMMWQIGFDGRNRLVITTGTVVKHDGTAGEMREETTEVEPKGNRTMQAQALQEARKRYKDKFLGEGYRPAGNSVPIPTKPTLAYTWVTKKDMEEAKEKRKRMGQRIDPKWRVVDRFPVAVQPKLDGIRMLASLSEANQVRCRSRENNSFSTLEHIEEELRDFFTYLPANAELDGELYNLDMDFTTITSCVKSVKRRHPRIKEIVYHIFDIITDLTEEVPEDKSKVVGIPYEKRFELLSGAYMKYLEDGHVNTAFVILPYALAFSEEEILLYHEECVKMGYEGVIIRKLAGERPTYQTLKESEYHPGRNSNILKYKQFLDEEALVIGVEEAKGTEEGSALFKVRDKRGNEFNIRMRGSISQRREWFENPDQVIGKKVTLRFQELSIHGVPRFPVGIALRDYE